MIEHKILLHYEKHDNIDDDHLTIGIPEERATYAKDIVGTIVEYLEKPVTYKENDDAYGNFLDILDNRIQALRGITGCELSLNKTVDTIVRIRF